MPVRGPGRSLQRGAQHAVTTGTGRRIEEAAIQKQRDDEAPWLTPRQLEVLELVAKGLTNREIARVLGITPGTAKVHVSAVIAALDVTNRTEAAMALQELRGPGASPAASAQPTPGVPGFGARPAIAVLPFDDLSPTHEDRGFADAFVDDLTTHLAAWRWFPVIARNSAFRYRGPVDVATAGRELGARYLIEGSVRRVDDRLRVNVQLLEAETARHLLAEKLDRRVGDLFAVQDELVERIVGALEPALLRFEGLRALRRPVESLSAWERVQRGMALVHGQDPAQIEDAIALFGSAITEEPGFAAAYAGLAMARWLSGLFEVGATQQGPADAERVKTALERAVARFAAAREAGQRATQLDPRGAAGHLGLGGGLAAAGELEPAIAAFERALELDPSSALAAWALGTLLGWTGRWEEGAALFERALRLSPCDPLLHHFEGALAALHLRAGRYPEALAHARRSVEVEPGIGISHRPLVAAALALLGRLDEARAEVEPMRQQRPDFNLALAGLVAPPEVVERLREGLTLAGFAPREPGAG